MIEIRTLQDYFGAYRIHGYCPCCQRHQVLPLGRYIAEFGGSYPLGDLVQRLRCRACGRRGIEIRISYAAVGGYAHGGGGASPGAPGAEVVPLFR